MANITCNPYLYFDGNCREAMNFYHKIFGGELSIQTYGEVEQSCPAARKDKVMHARLLGGDILLMASDEPVPSNESANGKVHLALAGSNEKRLREIFEGLATDGEICIPLEKQIWGDIYGGLRDRFGFQWMININAH